MTSGGSGAARWDNRLAGYRNVLAVVAALTVLQAAMAALSIVVALTLRAEGVSNAILGLVAAGFAVGLLLGTRVSPEEIRRIGHIRAYTLFAAIGAIAALALATGVHVAGWAMLQVVLGLCCAGLLTSGESWISDAAPAHQRGAILAFYHMVSKTGAIAGPLLVASAASGPGDSLGGIMLVAGLFAASLIPVAATNRAQPTLATATPFGPWRILKRAPAAAFAALCAGAVNNAIAQLYPVFAADLSEGSGTAFAAQFNAALLAGAMVGLWPAGLLSDRVDRRLVISGLGFLGALAAAALVAAALAGSRTGILTAAFLLGTGTLSHYAVAVAHAADRAQPEQVTSMMAGILAIWGFGSVIGPPVAGIAMSLEFGSTGLFVFAGLALAALGVSMFTRAVRTDPVPEDEKEPFAVAPATSYAIPEFDPRGEDDGQLDLFAPPDTEAPQ